MTDTLENVALSPQAVKATPSKPLTIFFLNKAIFFQGNGSQSFPTGLILITKSVVGIHHRSSCSINIPSQYIELPTIFLPPHALFLHSKISRSQKWEVGQAEPMSKMLNRSCLMSQQNLWVFRMIGPLGNLQTYEGLIFK